MVTLPGTSPPTEGGALVAGDTVKPPGEVVEGAAVRPIRLAEARCCCSRRWSGVITWVGFLSGGDSRKRKGQGLESKGHSNKIFWGVNKPGDQQNV